MNFPWFKAPGPHENTIWLTGMLASASFLLMMALVLNVNANTSSVINGAQTLSQPAAVGDAPHTAPTLFAAVIGFGRQPGEYPYQANEYPYPDYDGCYHSDASPPGNYAHWVCGSHVSNFYSGVFDVYQSNAPTLGQLAYLHTTCSPTTPSCTSTEEQDKDLGPANVTYTCPGYQDEGYLDPDSCIADGLTPVYTPDCYSYPIPSGDDYVQPVGIDGYPYDSEYECYSYKTVPASFTTAVEQGALMQAVAPGTPLTLEWSCLPHRSVIDLTYGGGDLWNDGNWSADLLYSINPLVTGTSGTGFGTGGALYGTAAIIAPSEPGDYTYTLSCDGPFNLPSMSLTVTVSDSAQLPPTVNITGNGQSGTVGVDVGKPVDIEATFGLNNAGETLTHSAINDGSNNALTSQDPASRKSYTYTPSAPGSATFYPALQTSLFPSWNNYGQSLTVTASCPAGQTAQGNQCVPQTGQCIDPPSNAYLCGPQDAVQSTLVSACSQPPVACQYICQTGFTLQDGQCVPNQCTGAHENNDWPTCSCATNYKPDPTTGECVPVPPTLTLSANPARVRAGNTTSLTWSASPLPGDGSVTCSISSNPDVFSISDPGLNTQWGATQQTGALESRTTFTLSCSGGAIQTVSKSIDVLLIPNIIEI